MGLLFDNVYDDIRYVKTNYIDIDVTLPTSSKNTRFTQGAPTRIGIRIQLLYPSSQRCCGFYTDALNLSIACIPCFILIVHTTIVVIVFSTMTDALVILTLTVLIAA